jgi:hypothetical protein
MRCRYSHYALWTSSHMLNYFIQQLTYSLLIYTIVIHSIIICIQKLWGLTISYPPQSTLPEWKMTWPCHIPVLLAGNVRQVDYFTSCWLIYLDFIHFGNPAPSPQFLCHTITNCKYLNHAHLASEECYGVGCMYKCSIMVVIQTDWYCAWSAQSTTCMRSHTSTLLLNFVTTIMFPFSLECKRQSEIAFTGRLTAWFGI